MTKFGNVYYSSHSLSVFCQLRTNRIYFNRLNLTTCTLEYMALYKFCALRITPLLLKKLRLNCTSFIKWSSCRSSFCAIRSRVLVFIYMYIHVHVFPIFLIPQFENHVLLLCKLVMRIKIHSFWNCMWLCKHLNWRCKTRNLLRTCIYNYNL